MAERRQWRQDILWVLVYAPLVGIMLVSVAFNVIYWGQWGGALYQVLGASLAIAEVLMLPFLRAAKRAREWGRFAALAVLALATFSFNLFIDFSAVITRAEASITQRSQAVASYDEAVRTRNEAEEEINRLTSHLGGSQRRSTAALATDMHLAQARRDSYKARGRAVPRRTAERAAFAEAAYADAVSLDRQLVRREQAQAAIARVGARPSGEAPENVGMARLLGMFGIQVEPRQVGVVVTFGAAALMKLFLILGGYAFSPNWRPGVPRVVPLAEVASPSPIPPTAILPVNSPSGGGERVSVRHKKELKQALDDLERGF